MTTRITASFALLLALTPLPSLAQQAPTMVKLSTGSELATWMLPAEGAKRHTTPIIFLHGGPGLYTEARRFEEGKPLRAAGFATLYFDQAGGGKSARLPAGQYSLERAVQDLEALRVSLGQEKIILWGNSYGASLATVYASRYPQHVAGVLLTAPGMFPGFDGKRDYSVTNRGKVEYSKAVTAAVSLIDSKGSAAEAQLPQDQAGKLFDELIGTELIDAVVCKGSTVKPPALPGGGNLYAQRALFRDLKKLKFKPGAMPKVPALIVRGSCDFLPADSAAEYSRFFGATLVAIPNSGHGLIENRAAVEAALTSFATGALAAVP